MCGMRQAPSGTWTAGACKKKRAIHRRTREGTWYDGYYDDVPPIDADRVGERVDPALIRRIALVILGAVGLITLSAALLMLL